MKISYRREIRHNYLIIDPEDIEWSGYECQMLAENQIDGILRFQLRQMDEGVLFYYEITSRQPLTRLLENKKIRAAELRSLVLGIAAALERMEKYLLREERVLLEPDYLYIEPESFRIFLCLIPGLQRDFAEDFGRLLEYLLGSVDHHDKESVVLVYGMYQETRKENYGIEDIVRLLYQERSEEKGIVMKKSVDVKPPAKETLWLTDNQLAERQTMAEGKYPSERQKQIVEKADPPENHKKGWWKTLKQWFRDKFQKKDEVSAETAWEVLFPDNPDPKEENVSGEGIKDLLQSQLSYVPAEAKGGGAEEGAEKRGTALLADHSKKNSDHILRALNAGEEDIPIAYYPFIIGKQENLVDYKLDRDTVSRLHIRIDRIEEQYRVQDLNSTNGTMVRGKLLDNNESVELRPGDEIAIAQYRFRFE